MRRVFLATAALFALFTLSWLVFTALGVLTPDATEEWLRSLGPAAAFAAIVGLLAADIALPIPGSIVLSAGGIVLGWPLAALAGCTGLVLGSTVGYGACRRFGRRAFDRFVTPVEAARFGRWLDRFGTVAIILSRPVPMMSETLACLAGLAGMRTRRFLSAVFFGSAPYAWFFAWTGDRIGRVNEEPGLALLLALGVPAAYWFAFALLGSVAIRGGWGIRTDRLRLRPIAETDAPGYAALLADPAVHPRVVENGPVAREAIPGRIRLKCEERLAGTGTMFAILREDSLIGYVAIHGIKTPTVALSYALLSSEHGRGYGREAVAAVLARSRELGFDRIVARTHRDNPASSHLLEALGFEEGEPDVEPPRRVFVWRAD